MHLAQGAEHGRAVYNPTPLKEMKATSARFLMMFDDDVVDDVDV